MKLTHKKEDLVYIPLQDSVDDIVDVKYSGKKMVYAVRNHLVVNQTKITVHK